jgi:hypothetical protein
MEGSWYHDFYDIKEEPQLGVVSAPTTLVDLRCKKWVFQEIKRHLVPTQLL